MKIEQEDYNLTFNYKPIYCQYIICNGKGLEHSLDGPALICKRGMLHYYIMGTKIGINLSNKQFQQAIKEYIFSS